MKKFYHFSLDFQVSIRDNQIFFNKIKNFEEHESRTFDEKSIDPSFIDLVRSIFKLNSSLEVERKVYLQAIKLSYHNNITEGTTLYAEALENYNKFSKLLIFSEVSFLRILSSYLNDKNLSFDEFKNERNLRLVATDYHVFEGGYFYDEINNILLQYAAAELEFLKNSIQISNINSEEGQSLLSEKYEKFITFNKLLTDRFKHSEVYLCNKKTFLNERIKPHSEEH